MEGSSFDDGDEGAGDDDGDDEDGGGGEGGNVSFSSLSIRRGCRCLLLSEEGADVDGDDDDEDDDDAADEDDDVIVCVRVGGTLVGLGLVCTRVGIELDHLVGISLSS